MFSLDLIEGVLELRIGKNSLNDHFEGAFPEFGALIPDEYVSPDPIPAALAEVARNCLAGLLPRSVSALLNRTPPAPVLQAPGECTRDAAIRVSESMAGGCLVIQGPPGTGKTYTASQVIAHLLCLGKRVGVSSNSHKAVMNLVKATSSAMLQRGQPLRGIKVGGDPEDPFFENNPEFFHLSSSTGALAAFQAGIVGGTAWLFSGSEWVDQLDYLFIDEAGQVCLANAVAMARSTKNLVLLGDQMQLEQPVQGSHPGNSGLSVLQYALMDESRSKPDAPAFYAVVPPDYGLFLGESRRMHPDVCEFISESIYEGRLGSHVDSCKQNISVQPKPGCHIPCQSGIVFCGVEHEGNIQDSEEEAARVRQIYDELLGLTYTASDRAEKPLDLEDFLFISPCNAQVRKLKAVLPEGARVGSVDKFQGQEAPVCILSLGSSFGEYGSRGLKFILDPNRVNVAISRAKCLAIVVADPRIATSPANSIEDMKLLNLFCKLQAVSSTSKSLNTQIEV